jgi:hypothetical protein
MRLPRVRLSVRTSILLVAVVGCGLGWIARRAHARRDAVEAILRAGGRVKYDWQYKNGALVRNGAPRGPKWLVVPNTTQRNTPSSKGLRQSQKTTAHTLPTSDELAEIAACWESLTPETRDAILALIRKCYANPGRGI